MMMADVDFDESQYWRSHRRHPRGRGSWAFCPLDAWRTEDYLSQARWFTGSYSEAKREAQRAFAADGIEIVVVCP